jgi:hypothetical protein
MLAIALAHQLKMTRIDLTGHALLTLYTASKQPIKVWGLWWKKGGFWIKLALIAIVLLHCDDC